MIALIITENFFVSSYFYPDPLIEDPEADPYGTTTKNIDITFVLFLNFIWITLHILIIFGKYIQFQEPYEKVRNYIENATCKQSIHSSDTDKTQQQPQG